MTNIVDRLRAKGTTDSFERAIRDEAADEIERLQRIIDSRPAINAGLPQTYIEWSQSIYVVEAIHAGLLPQH